MNSSSGAISKKSFFFELLMPFVCKLNCEFFFKNSSVVDITFAGFPPTTELGGVDFVTIEPAATIQ